jgi:hypothetical protein
MWASQTSILAWQSGKARRVQVNFGIDYIALAARPAALAGIVSPRSATTSLVRLFRLDRLPVGRRPLICHWHLDADGRLACTWEPDIGLV